MKEWSWKTITILIVLLFVLMCFGLPGWVRWQLKDLEPFTARNYYPSLSDRNSDSNFEPNAEIEYPPSAHEIYIYQTGLRDISAKTRFSMHASDLETFLQSTLCDDQELTDMSSGVPPQGDGTSEWWIPNQANIIKGCVGTREHSHQTILVDMSDPEIYIVYVNTSTY